MGFGGFTGFTRPGLTLPWDHPEDSLPQMGAVLEDSVGSLKPTSKTKKKLIDMNLAE